MWREKKPPFFISYSVRIDTHTKWHGKYHTSVNNYTILMHLTHTKAHSITIKIYSSNFFFHRFLLYLYTFIRKTWEHKLTFGKFFHTQAQHKTTHNFMLGQFNWFAVNLFKWCDVLMLLVFSYSKTHNLVVLFNDTF